MEPIRITPTGEKEVSRVPNRGGGYTVTIERFGVDQYGHEWHSFHTRIVTEQPETGQRDNQSIKAKLSSLGDN